MKNQKPSYKILLGKETKGIHCRCSYLTLHGKYSDTNMLNGTSSKEAVEALATSRNSRSQTMKCKKGKLPVPPPLPQPVTFADGEMKAVIKENLNQALGRLGTISDLMMKRNIELGANGVADGAPPVMKAVARAKEAFKKLRDK